MEKISRIHHTIATVFGLGYSPLAPGTVGSLAGLILCLLLHAHMAIYIIVFLILFTVGVISSGKVEEEIEQKDPPSVVIDEAACIFLVFLFVPIEPLIILTGFILYRIIDIVKFPPMRSCEMLKGGWGIMLDDLVGAVYTNLILQILISLKVFG